MGVASVIGALRVNLGLNSAGFRSGLDQSQQRLAKFGAMADRVFLAVGAAAVAAAAGMGVMVHAAINNADTMGEVAEQIGISVEALTAYGYAAKLSGSSTETLATGVRKLSQNMANAAKNSTGAMAQAFDALNVSVTGADGRLRGADEVLMDIADRFAGMENGAAKTALAVQLFGKSGAELVPLLNRGRDGIAELTAEADRLGITLSSGTAAQAGAFNDVIDRIGATLQGVANKLMVALLPALTTFANLVLSAAQGGTQFDGVIKGIGGAMTVLARVVAIAFAHLNDLYDLFKIWVAAKIVLFVGSLAGAMVTLARTIRVVGLSMAVVTSMTRAKITAIVLLAAAVAKLTGTYDTLVGWVKTFGEEVMNALPPQVREGVDSLTGAITGLGNEIETVDDMGAQALGGYLQRTQEVSDSFGEVGQSAVRATDAMSDGLEASKDKAKELGDTVKSAFQQAGSSLRSIFDGTKKWNEALGDVLFSLAQMAFSNINFGGPSQGGTNMFGDVLSGLFGGLFGFKDGGSFKVGGTGGIDSQTVAFNASPDEVVSITKPGQGDGGQVVQINQNFELAGAIGADSIAAMVRRGATEAVDNVKKSLPGWNVQMNRNGRIA